MKRRSLVALPVGIADTATREGWLKWLALFVNVKSLHSNSKIYNYSCRNLSDKLKNSGFKTNKDTVRKGINFLVSKGLAELNNGTLILRGKRKFSKLLDNQKFLDPSCHKIIQVRVYNTFLDQIRNLQSRSIIKSVNQQIYNIKSKSDLMKVNTERLEGGMAKTNVMMSLETIADLSYSSRTTANKIKKFSVDTGIITSTIIGGRELTNRVSKEGHKNFGYNFGVKTFFYKGSVYEVPRCYIGLGSAINYTISNTVVNKKRFTKNSTKNETRKIKRDGSYFIDWIMTLD